MKKWQTMILGATISLAPNMGVFCSSPSSTSLVSEVADVNLKVFAWEPEEVSEGTPLSFLKRITEECKNPGRKTGRSLSGDYSTDRRKNKK